MTVREIFFNKKNKFLTLEKVLEISGAKLNKEHNLKAEIFDVATLDKADSKQISFLHSTQYLEKFQATQAGFCFIDEATAAKVDVNHSSILLVHRNPYFAYAKIAATFYEEKIPDIANQSQIIHPTAQIGEGTIIAPLAYIGKNVKIGKNCFIAPTACIMDNCEIGDNTIINAGAVISYSIIGSQCIIHNGVKIGQDGFGFVHDNMVNHKIIQLGIVQIGNNVEIGANSCVDRGAIENTIIGDDVKIDNLVQIGHNVIIGRGTVISGCVAVAGSAKIGNFVLIGGKAAIGGHIEIGDGAKIAALSGVMRSIEAKATYGGIPAIPINEWRYLTAKLLSLVKKKKSF